MYKIKVSTRGRYALRLMIDLAENANGTYITLKDVSKRQDISVKYLEQIINSLSKVGFLKSFRGPQGGYQLAKPAKEYTVGDILRATEGSLAPVACLGEQAERCERESLCATLDFWRGLYEKINEYVDSFTLDDLVKNHRKNIIDYNI